ncbi:MAG: NAD(P)/FAD-dependent oxidoreductase [Candidatus Altiarchaeota archaeon]|nr:NAD(P)/FAD-dependent oxidoreductase [Candidatus Altiarchaeota archaeon]
MRECDILIIGGGVVGCAIARELSKYELKTILLEKECDVCMGTSGRNSGVAHAGFYVQSGTLKAELNVKGHRMLPSLCSELGVPYEEVGKLVVAKKAEEIPYLRKLKETGDRNGTHGLEIIDGEEVKGLEPNIRAFAALYSPSSAILDPFDLTIALAENALSNGVRIILSTKVEDIKKKKDNFTVKTNKVSYRSKIVVNSAGLYSDKIAAMVGIDKYRIYPCRGEYHILDKNRRNLIKHLVYPVPPKDVGGLGVHITPTIHGNIMLGPSAEYICEPEVSTTCEVMDQLYNEARELLPEISRMDFIRSFSGVRPKLTPAGSTKAADFVIEEDPQTPGFINLIGIESPGLTAAPAIAEKVAAMVGDSTELRSKEEFNPRRKPKIGFNQLPDEEKARLIKEDPAYGRIVCRCESVTEREVLDALDNPFKVRNIDAIKRRCRAGMGRCQSGFCLPKIVEIMEEHHSMTEKDLRLNCEGSELFIGRAKDLRRK